jgi:hypothetical protein
MENTRLSASFLHQEIAGTLLCWRRSAQMRVSMFLLRSWRRARLGRKWRHICQGRQKIVGFVEKVDLRVSHAVSNRDEDTRLTLGA